MDMCNGSIWIHVVESFLYWVTEKTYQPTVESSKINHWCMVKKLFFW